MTATKTIYITGASTGIGRATALAMANAGWRVFAGVRSEAAAEELRDEHASIVPVRVDVTDQASIDAASTVVASEVGDRGLDALFNNAGVPSSGPTETLAMEHFREIFEVNFFGQLAVTKSVLPLLRAARGRLVFNTSLAGLVALPYMGPYATSKHAVEALADCLRAELRQFGIAVILVEPGLIATPIWDKALAPMNHEAEADEAGLYSAGMAFAISQAERSQRIAIPVERVSNTVLKALTTKRPRLRYVVGLDAKALTAARQHLPKVTDSGIAAIMALDARKRR
jgi:NAD(P)-dependent dehydrogenase (short-subunit alcohol dehydrogenase family)